MSYPSRNADEPCPQRRSADFAHPSTNESGSSPQQVVSDRRYRHPRGVGVEQPGGHMRQSTALQLRIDLRDDRVPAVDLISSNSVETSPVDGGEERVILEQVEQWVLPTHAFGFVEFRDAADQQTSRRLQCLSLRGERGERDFSDFGLRNPCPGFFVVDRFRVFAARPCVVADRPDQK